LISTKTKYGLRALINLASHHEGKPVYLKDIAQRENISLRYLENIFTKLRVAGILKSWQGRGGGFSFGCDIKDITLLDIVTTLEDNPSFCSCIEMPESCEKSSSCITRDVLISISKSMKDFLSSITMSSLLEVHDKDKP